MVTVDIQHRIIAWNKADLLLTHLPLDKMAAFS